MTGSTTAYLSLGSNIGDRRGHLRRAVDTLAERCRVLAVSNVYETEPVGGVEQDAFYNIVVKVETERTAHELLDLCRELERQADRIRGIRWGPRTLDVDILLHGDEPVDDEPELIVPHPRMTERNFVMVPLLEVAPELDGHPLLVGYDPEQAIGEVCSIGAL